MSERSNHDSREQEWLPAIRRGDRVAFEALFMAYGPALWEFAVRYAEPDTASDVVQDVMFAVWERRASIEVRTTLRAYLFGAVRRKALEYARHNRVIGDSEEVVGADGAAWMGEAPAAPDDAANLAELEAALDAALATLPERQRILLTLRWRHGMTYEQISEAMGISVAAAKMQVSRTQRVIRPLLERFTRE